MAKVGAYAKNEHPVLLAANAHFKLVTIHPFVDGNGRTARLLMNLILLRHGYPMAVMRSEGRTTYLDAVKVGQVNANLSAFYTFIEQSVERSLDVWLAAAQGKPALVPFATSQPPANKKKLLRIGALAQASGENVHTLRYWTQEGLLQTSGKTEGGYQLYRPEMAQRAKRIRELQTTRRLTLQEIQQTLGRTA